VFSALVIMVATQHAAAGMLASQLDDQRAQAAKQVGVWRHVPDARLYFHGQEHGTVDCNVEFQ
jgi:hypothetical protein